MLIDSFAGDLLEMCGFLLKSRNIITCLCIYYAYNVLLV